MSQWQPARWRGKALEDITAEELPEVPDSLLMGMVKYHFRYGKLGAFRDAQKHIVIAEARRRGWNDFRLNSMEPPKCACGGPGHYIVGKVTYCRKCKDKGNQRLEMVGRNCLEPKRADIDAMFNSLDKHRRTSDRLKSKLVKGRKWS